MTKTRYTLLISLLSTIVYGQKFETNLLVSPLVTFNSSAATKSKIAYGFSGSVQEYYNLTNYFALGSELTYSFERYMSTRDYEGSSIPEESLYYESTLTVHTLKLPLLLRVKTTSAWFLTVGYGLTYNMDYKAAVDFVSAYWNNREKTRIAIPERSVDTENDLGSYFTLGIGRTFTVQGLRLLVEMHYLKSFASYTIQHGEPNGSAGMYSQQISPQYLGFKIGLGL